jgi:hypothetical protein
MKSTKPLKWKAYSAVVLFCYPFLFLSLWSRGRLFPNSRYQPYSYTEAAIFAAVGTALALFYVVRKLR